MVANPDKFQVIFLGSNIPAEICIELNSFTIRSSEEVKLLGVTIDRRLSFLPHIQNICGRILAKTRALMRVRSYLSQKQADLLFFSHLMSPLTYCPLVWMFCYKQASTILNKTHCKALKARFNDFSATFDDLLIRAETIDIHTRNLRFLMEEIFKTLNNLNPQIMWNTFNFKYPNKYELRRGINLEVPKARTTRAINSFDFRAAMAWNHLPATVKASEDIKGFRGKLVNQNIYCRCKICNF